MWNGKTVSVVLPAYNEQDGVRRAIESFYETGVVDDVLVVDNNSTDQTVAEIGKTKATLIQETTQGYGAALTRGLREANSDYIVTAEPDGTFDGKDVIKLLAYAEDFELVCGTRTTKELIWDGANMGWLLRNGNTIVAKFLELLHNTCSLSDCGCTMRLIRRDALQKILPLLTVTGSHFLPEMLILSRKKGLQIIEIPVNYHDRVGSSKITGTLRGTISTAWKMFTLIVSYRFKRV